jgi:hypothetical protein
VRKRIRFPETKSVSFPFSGKKNDVLSGFRKAFSDPDPFSGKLFEKRIRFRIRFEKTGSENGSGFFLDSGALFDLQIILFDVFGVQFP